MLGEGLLELLGAPALLLVSLAVFWKGDEGLSEAARGDVSSWLRRIKVPKDPGVVGLATSHVFQRIYGPRHLSIRCLIASFLTSAVVFALLYILSRSYTEFRLAGLYAGQSPEVVYEDSAPRLVVYLRELSDIRLIGSFLILNPVGDYLSLLITRRGLAALTARRIRAGALVVVEFLASLIVFLAWITFVGVLVFWVLGLVGLSGANSALGVRLEAFGYLFVEVWAETRAPDPNNWFPESIDFFRAILLTTFVSSVWIWVAVLGTAAFRLLARSGRVLGFLQYALPIEDKPVRALGLVGVATAALALITLAFLGALIGLFRWP